MMIIHLFIFQNFFPVKAAQEAFFNLHKQYGYFNCGKGDASSLAEGDPHNDCLPEETLEAEGCCSHIYWRYFLFCYCCLQYSIVKNSSMLCCLFQKWFIYFSLSISSSLSAWLFNFMCSVAVDFALFFFILFMITTFIIVCLICCLSSWSLFFFLNNIENIFVWMPLGLKSPKGLAHTLFLPNQIVREE